MDINKVIRGMRICTSDRGCASCPYRGARCADRMMMDALTALEATRHNEPAPRNKRDKPVEMLTMDGAAVRRFNSCEEAERVTGVSAKSISRVCNGHRRSAGGNLWRFI